MEGGIKFLHFLSVFFFRKVNLKQIEEQKIEEHNKNIGESGGMLPRKVFKNLDTVMAILALFEQFLWQILFNFFASNSKSFTKYDTFCSHIFDLCVLKA